MTKYKQRELLNLLHKAIVNAVESYLLFENFDKSDDWSGYRDALMRSTLDPKTFLEVADEAFSSFWCEDLPDSEESAESAESAESEEMGQPL